MNKIFFGVTFILLYSFSSAVAQVAAAPDMYPDYQRFLGSLKYVPPAKQDLKDIWNNLLDSASVLKDEAPVHITTAAVKKKTLDDEKIYDARKNSVFIVGKLKKATGGPSTVSFDLSGTAFAIDKKGVCVTNYHVLKDLIGKNKREIAGDSAWFIVSHNRNIYIIDRILAYSINNDLAVFSVITNDAPLLPVPVGKPAPTGATVYTISHPGGYFYNFGKGIVSRNATIGSEQIVTGHNPQGKPHIRMEITADYGSGASGGPVLDKYGNVVGVISVTTPLMATAKDAAGNLTSSHVQMVIKSTIPVKALRELLGMDL